MNSPTVAGGADHTEYAGQRNLKNHQMTFSEVYRGCDEESDKISCGANTTSPPGPGGYPSPLILCLNIPKPPGLLTDDSCVFKFIRPSGFPANAPAQSVQRAEKPVSHSVLAKDRSACPHLAILRDGGNGTTSGGGGDSVRRQSDPAQLDRLVITLGRIHDPKRSISLFQKVVETAS
jgi:hypothetical protein